MLNNLKTSHRVILLVITAIIGTLLIAYVSAGREGVITPDLANASLEGDACIEDDAIQFGDCPTADDSSSDDSADTADDSADTADDTADSADDSSADSADGTTPVAQKVLIFSETANYKSVEDRIKNAKESVHDGIVAGRAFLTQELEAKGIEVDSTDYSDGYFTDEALSRYDAVIFLSPSGDALNNNEQNAFKKYIQNKNGFVGIHYAVHGLMEKEWTWYKNLIGTSFDTVAGGHYTQTHLTITEGKLVVTDKEHPSTSFLADDFLHTDEWYKMTQVPTGAKLLIKLDQDSVAAPGMDTLKPIHPISWYRPNYDGGRVWYTQLGDNPESYEQANFQKHLTEGILWAIEGNH